MPQTSAQLKGSLFPLSVLQLEDNNLEKLQQQLTKKLEQAPSFFYRAPLVVNIEQIGDADIDFLLLKQSIEAKDFICVGICNGSNAQKKQARIAGLATLQQPKVNTKPSLQEAASTIATKEIAVEAKPVPAVAAKAAKIVKQNVRSGQQIYAKDCDLVIIGSVGNGAEVISDGNIHIYGKLRGRAIAGAKGNKESAIFCQSIEPELVSIAGTYWLSEAIEQSHWQQSGFIKLEHEQLVIDALPAMNN